MLLFSIFLQLNFILVFPERALKINDILKDITNKSPKSHPETLSSYFADFINTKGLSENRETSDLDEFKNVLSIRGESSDLETANSIWPFYKKHNQYMKETRSRNSLAYFLHKNSVSQSLEQYNILTNFYDIFKPTKNDVKSLSDFIDFMQKFDSKLDISLIRRIYKPVFMFQKYLERQSKKIDLVIEVNKKSELGEYLPILKSFYNSYGLRRHNISNFRNFRDLLYDLDYEVSDADIKKIYPMAAKMSEISKKAEIRKKLELEIYYGDRKVFEIEKEIFDFAYAYDFIDLDTSNIDNFEKHIKDQDYLLDKNLLPSLYIHVYIYFQYLNMKNVLYLLLDFIGDKKGIRMHEISNYIDPFISVFNLQDYQKMKNLDDLKLYIRSFIGAFSRKDAAKIYPLYIKYLGFLEFTETRDVLLSVIRKKPNFDLYDILPQIERFYKLYKVEKKEIFGIKGFGSLLKKYDRNVSEEIIQELFPYVKLYMQYIDRQKIFDTLISRLKSKSETSYIEKHSEETKKKTIDELLGDLIEIFEFKETHFQIYSEFNRYMKEKLKYANDSDIKLVFDNFIVYAKFKKYIDNLNKLNPGDLRPDGLIEPPTYKGQLFWYNFFAFFGGKPHLVIKVKSVDELMFLKRWFDSFYKYSTGIYYYITEDRIKNIDTPLPISSNSGGNRRRRELARTRYIIIKDKLESY